MKAILIDPDAKTVTDVECAKGIDAIYALIRCGTFDVVRVGHFAGEDQTMFVDDNGLYKKDQTFFTLNGGGPFAGPALILGSDQRGESTSTRFLADQVRPQVEFKNLRVKDWTSSTTEENADMPWGGKGSKVIGAQPIFEEKS